MQIGVIGGRFRTGGLELDVVHSQSRNMVRLINERLRA